MSSQKPPSPFWFHVSNFDEKAVARGLRKVENFQDLVSGMKVDFLDRCVKAVKDGCSIDDFVKGFMEQRAYALATGFMHGDEEIIQAFRLSRGNPRKFVENPWHGVPYAIPALTGDEREVAVKDRDLGTVLLQAAKDVRDWFGEKILHMHLKLTGDYACEMRARIHFFRLKAKMEKEGGREKPSWTKNTIEVELSESTSGVSDSSLFSWTAETRPRGELATVSILPAKGTTGDSKPRVSYNFAQLHTQLQSKLCVEMADPYFSGKGTSMISVECTYTINELADSDGISFDVMTNEEVNGTASKDLTKWSLRLDRVQRPMIELACGIERTLFSGTPTTSGTTQVLKDCQEMVHTLGRSRREFEDESDRTRRYAGSGSASGPSERRRR